MAAKSDVDDARGQQSPIAIIGMSCRFPGAANPREFWELLRNGRDAITRVPSSRWNADDFYDADPAAAGKATCREGGFLSSVTDFDTKFFGISRREAIRMDPQQRLMLELVWEGFEDADLPPAELAGSATGVFLGCGVLDYGVPQFSVLSLVEAYTSTGFVSSIMSNRVSYLFDLRGPSFTVDSACSTSLVAVHLACESLRRGESELALAGAVNLLLLPIATVGMSKMFALSPRGRCRFLDADADGYVRGEGGGVVVLKRLDHALRDGDPIRAVILGDAVNQDGRSNGLTAPNRQAQEAVLREAYQLAGVSPAEVPYIEAHGTGTLLGDPIEAHALGTVLSPGRPADRPSRVGSVKTNIGHLEAAAGMAGLIKLVLMLEHRQLVPSLHYRQPNPFVKWDRVPLQVQTELSDWPETRGAPFAGISSFGFGGTNAHIVVQAAPPKVATTVRPRPPAGLPLLTLSARSPEALKALAQLYWDYLQNDPEGRSLPLGELCAHAARYRSHHACRAALPVENRRKLLDHLEALVQGRSPYTGQDSQIASGANPALAFVFPGKLPTLHQDDWQLLRSFPAFQSAWDDCAAACTAVSGLELPAPTAPLSEAVLNDPTITQLLSFGFEYAMSQLGRSWGLSAAITIGLGPSEFAAAVDSTALTLTEATRQLLEAAKKTVSEAPVPAPSSDAMFQELLTQEPGLKGVLVLGDAASIRSSTEKPTDYPDRLPAVPLCATGRSIGASLAEAVAPLYVAGANFVWSEVFPHHVHQRRSLPTYPFQRERCWLEAPAPVFATGEEDAIAVGCEATALDRNARAPHFELISTTGISVSLAACLQDGPVALVWLRGLWCPYSQVLIRELQRVAPALKRLSVKPLAIIPATNRREVDSGERQRLDFPILCDPGLQTAAVYGLTYPLSDKTDRVFREQFQIDLAAIHERGQRQLPLLAIHLIRRDSIIEFATVTANPTRQPRFNDLVAAAALLK